MEERKLNGQVTNTGSLKGSVESGGELQGSMSVNGVTGSKNAVLYIPQELTSEQIAQARKNIRIIGEDVKGRIFTPYTVDEANDYAYIYDEPMEAQEGAEILNDYENNIAIGLWSQASGYQTQALGNYSLAGGWWTRADGQCSVAEGLLSITSGHFCHAEGTRTLASLNNAHSEGDSSKATGRQSHAEGTQTTSSGQNSHSEGYLTVSSGLASHSEGWGTIAAGQRQTAMGKFNIKDTSNLVIVGKGSKDTARSNAFTLSSEGTGWFAKTVSSDGADYAEFFEWADGNPNGVDRIGMVVTLEGEKIRLANEGDDVLGIVSAATSMIGDVAEYEWKYKYVTDEYGRIIYDEPVEEFVEYTDQVDPTDETTWVTVKVSTGFHAYPKLNPNYDPTQDYTSREKRKEWDAIGLLGKVYVNDDGTCIVGKYAKVKANGVVTLSEEKTNMRVMKRMKDGVVWVLLK